LLLSGRAPFRALALMASDKATFVSGLEDKVQALSSNRMDARSLAEEWVRQDVELALQWLIRRLQQTIRLRARGAADSKAITPRGNDPLHNSWHAVPLEALFRRLQDSERLLDRLGSGINVELALHALLLSFQTAKRGRS